MKNVYLLHFSPSGTGKKTILNIAEGIKEKAQENEITLHEIDMCMAANRSNSYKFDCHDLVLIVMPTASNLLGQPKEIITALNGSNTPFVPIVMYGNGYYGNSLKTLNKYMIKQGFLPVAAGAFIGQHSCSPEIASGRPDQKDRQVAINFGNRIYHKVYRRKDLSFHHNLTIDWPKEGAFSTIKCALIVGKGGMGTSSMPDTFKGIAVNHEQCVNCSICVKACPMDALSLENGKINYDRSKCIACMGCVNRCPKRAIKSNSQSLIKASANVAKYRHGRKEPTIYI